MNILHNRPSSTASSTAIKTTRTVYPQIYAYVTPDYTLNEGWIKIGYTEQRDVEKRIRQQTQTANIAHNTLWSGPAKFTDSDIWFRDLQLHSYLRKFKEVKQRANTEWFYYDGYPEEAYNHYREFCDRKLTQAKTAQEYQLRAEQEAAVRMTLAYAASAPIRREFLWNAKPRFGKTLSAYDLALRLKAHNVLIVTNRPAIANSWFDDFDTFIAWQTNYIFVSTADSLKDRPVFDGEAFEKFPSEFKGTPTRCMAFISLQDLKGSIYFGGAHGKLKWVKEINWDLLIIDEAHEGVDTFKTDVAFDNVTRAFTLHLSGTPFRAIASGNFSADQIYNWSYADEQAAKAAWPATHEQSNPYEPLPRLNLFSYQMSQMITDAVNKGADIDGANIDYAFDLNEFFATNDSGKFIHEADVGKWLDTLTRNEKYPFSTPALRAELKHTFWLLNRVASAKALEKLLKIHPVFEHYAVVIAAGDGKSYDDMETISEKSLDRVRAAIAENERTITLSVGQLTTGVTIPQWSAVMMLSNLQSASLYMQAAFRAQNPWRYEENGQSQRKENAYVFDFAPERTLIIYDEFANNLSSATAGGGGTSGDRQENIRKLLNFFPVIAEDNDGKMVALDVNQVLTIPRAIKAAEVVKRGFMSNFLFQNIAGIFASAEARAIIGHFNPVPQGRVTPSATGAAIDTLGVEVREDGRADVPFQIVLAQTAANFGEKIYGNISDTISRAAADHTANLATLAGNTFTSHILEPAKEIAKTHGVSLAQASLIVKNQANLLAREVEKVEKRADIRINEAQAELRQVERDDSKDEAAIAAARERFAAAQQRIQAEREAAIASTVAVKSAELTQKVTGEVIQRAEERKKTTVEDDIRSRLRGFARTIPSFLMAYGEPATTLENFDTRLNDAVFQEVTGITLDQFRTLRDKFNFFEPVVFNESVQEFLRKKEELADYFDESQTEDIFDYIPPQQTNQIFTPKRVVKLMIDKLEEESPGLFSDKEKTFADLYVKSGLYLTEIAKRLYKGLETQIPDNQARLKHILENQIHGFAPTEIIYNIAKNYIFGNFANINHTNLKHHDLTPAAKQGDPLNMKFDVIVGNPPYQEEAVGTSTKDQPIYPFFYDLAGKYASIYCLISPARFLFNAGATNKLWNEKMLSDNHLRVEYYAKESAEIFPNTSIMGGVVIIHRNTNKKFGPIGTFTSRTELTTIVNKVLATANAFLDAIISNRGQYRFSDEAYRDYPEEMKRTSDSRISTNAFTNFPELFIINKPEGDEEYIQIIGRTNTDDNFRWFKRKYLNAPQTFNQYKVLISKANGAALKNGTIVGVPFVTGKKIGSTETFLTVGGYSTKTEAINLEKYIKTKFVRVLVSVLKVTPDNTSEKWAKVPLQDFTPESDIDWTKSIPEIDQQLYAKYGLDEKEIAFIEEKIKAME